MKTTAKRALGDASDEERLVEEGPGPKKRKEEVDSILTREEKSVYAKKIQKVLNGKVFELEIRSKPGMYDLSDVVKLQN